MNLRWLGCVSECFITLLKFGWTQLYNDNEAFRLFLGI